VTFPQPIFGVSGRPVSVTSVGGLARWTSFGLQKRSILREDKEFQFCIT